MARATDPRRVRKRIALAAVCGALALGAYLLWRSAGLALEPPSVATQALDPAVARAIATAREDVRKSPRAAGAWGRLGMIFLAHDLGAEARRCFAEAERLDPREPRWPYYLGASLSSGQPDAAIPKMQRAAELCGTSPANPRLRLAELLLNAGKLDQAAECYRALVHAEPRNAMAALGLARVFFARRHLEAARAQARAAVDDVHTAKASRQLLAQIAEGLGDRAEATAELRRPTRCPRTFHRLIRSRRKSRELATGRQARVSHANQLLGANRPAEAAVLLRQVTDEYPDSEWAWMLLGRALLMSRNVSGAERALQHAVRLTPDSVGTQYHLGVVAFLKKDHRTAAEHFRKAMELQPDFAPAQCDLGRCLLQQGDRVGAEERFRTALRCQLG